MHAMVVSFENTQRYQILNVHIICQLYLNKVGKILNYLEETMNVLHSSWHYIPRGNYSSISRPINKH